jgi:hypothetical protein
MPPICTLRDDCVQRGVVTVKLQVSFVRSSRKGNNQWLVTIDLDHRHEFETLQLVKLGVFGDSLTGSQFCSGSASQHGGLLNCPGR